MDIYHFNINVHFLIFSSFPDPSTSSFSFSLWFLNFLFLITSVSDIWFLIRLILWCTHSTDFLRIALDNQIYHFLLHIFHRIMWNSMRENWYFPWPVCTFIGALRPAMRLISRFLCFILLMISCNPFITQPFDAAVHNCSRLAATLSLLIFDWGSAALAYLYYRLDTVYRVVVTMHVLHVCFFIPSYLPYLLHYSSLLIHFF